jgi:hypothetical protein
MSRKQRTRVLAAAVLAAIAGVSAFAFARWHAGSDLPAENLQTSGPLRCVSMIDLGEGFVGQMLEGSIVLENMSSQPVKLKSTLTSCGCTAVLGDVKTIAPNGRVPFKVTMSLKQEGPNQEHVAFPFESTERQSPINIQVYATGKIALPGLPKIIDFGTLKPEDLPAQRDLTVIAHPKWGLPIVSIGGEGFDTVDLGNGRYRVIARYVSTGLTVRQLAIRSPKFANATVTIPVHVRIAGTVEVTPDSAFVGPLTVGQEFSRTFRVRAPDLAGKSPSVVLPNPSDSVRTQLNAADEPGAWNLVVTGRCQQIGVSTRVIRVADAIGNHSQDIRMTVVGR